MKFKSVERLSNLGARDCSCIVGNSFILLSPVVSESRSRDKRMLCRIQKVNRWLQQNQKICVSAFVGFFLAKALADSRGESALPTGQFPEKIFLFSIKNLVK